MRTGYSPRRSYCCCVSYRVTSHVQASKHWPTARPAEENVQIQCGGALVRPGDVMVGDDDGVICVPSWMAEKVLEWATLHEEAENYVKEKIEAENVHPGKYYPPTPETVQEWIKVKKERGL